MKRNPKKTKLNKKKRLWKQAVRDNWGNECAKCKAKDCKLDTHHILYHQPLKWDEPQVGILLCSKCHKFSVEYSAHKCPFVFYQWLQEAHPHLCWTLNELLKDIK